MLKLNTLIIENMTQEQFNTAMNKAVNEFSPCFYVGIDIQPYGDVLKVFCANGTDYSEYEAQKLILMHHLGLKGTIKDIPHGVFETFSKLLDKEWDKPVPSIDEFPEDVAMLKPRLRAWNQDCEVYYPHA